MKLTAEYSIEKDLWNYTRYLNDTGYSYGVDNKNAKVISRLPMEVQDILNSQESDEVKAEKLLTYLKGQYKIKKADYNRITKAIEATWKEVGNQIVYYLEDLYNQTFPFDKVTTYLTSNSIYPYKYEERYFLISTKNIPMVAQMNIIIHELGHFMFYYYYPNLKDKLGSNKYELLKESLSFFTNPTQSGYPDEKNLRSLYISKKWNNIDETINEAVNLLSK